MDDNDQLWMLAIREWFVDNPAPLAALIGDRAATPSDEARRFLTDLALDTVEHPKGRPKEYSGVFERSIAHDVFSEWARLKAMPRNTRVAGPRNEAIRLVAFKRNATFDAVRGVVQRLKTVGITFEWWEATKPDWGRWAHKADAITCPLRRP